MSPVSTKTPDQTAQAHGVQPPRLASRIAGQRQVMVAVILLATLAGVSAVNPSFASVQNARDLLVQAAPAVIVGCGMTLVVLAGEIDISVGSLMGLLAAAMGILASPQHLGLPAPVAAGAVLLAGAGIGLINGWLVAIWRIPSIIATLGMLTILRGVTELLLGGVWITDLPPAIRAIGTGTVAGAPMCLCVAAIVAAGSLVIARGTRFGLRVYAVGANPEAAINARISPARVKVLVFMLAGVLTGVATLVSVPQLSVIESGIGAGFELVVVTAVVVGGTSIRGGRGGIAGTVIAALLLGSIRTILVFLNLGEMATYWERAIQGAFILAAVLADHLATSRAGIDDPAGAPA